MFVCVCVCVCMCVYVSIRKLQLCCDWTNGIMEKTKEKIAGKVHKAITLYLSPERNSERIMTEFKQVCVCVCVCVCVYTFTALCIRQMFNCDNGGQQSNTGAHGEVGKNMGRYWC